MKMLMSSADPSKISLTIKGLSVFVPTIVVFFSYFGVDVGSDELNALINSVADFVLLVGTVVATAVTIWGMVRKIANRF